MNATLRQIDAFVRVYRLKSITRAAAELGITQSAVSLLIRQLEAQFGVRLFDRTTRAVHPTAAALEAHTASQRILGDSNDLARRMRSLSEVKAGRVSFVASAGAASAVMPRLLAAFHRAHPEITTEMRDIAPDQLVASLLASDAEFGIGSVDGPLNDVAIEPLMRGRLSAIGPRNDAFATKSQLTWDDLAGQPVIAMRQDTAIRAHIDALLAARGKTLLPTYEVSIINTALSMTAQGLGLAILPSYMLPSAQFPDLVARPLARPTLWRQLSLIRREGRSLSPAAERFVALARRELAHHAAAVRTLRFTQ